MNIAKLRAQTADARAVKEAAEDAKFNGSRLHKYIDGLISQASKRGESEISENFYCMKEDVLGDKYGGPSIETVIRHYNREGFHAYSKSWCSPNGRGNTSLIISWK